MKQSFNYCQILYSRITRISMDRFRFSHFWISFTRMLYFISALMTIMMISDRAAFADQVFQADTEGEKPVIGVAWNDRPGKSYEAVCEAIEMAGGTAFRMEQIFSADLTYDENGFLTDCIDESGILTAEAAKLVKCNTWQNSNVESAMEGVSAVVFPGGAGVCPALYYTPEEPIASEGFSLERDVSDYLLMSYCLEYDIPILAICRGMQLLCTVCGADMIQDIPLYMDSLGIEYNFLHRSEPDEDGHRGYAFHDVTVISGDSLLYSMTKTDLLKDVPSWHHQAVRNVDGTRLVVTGTTDTCGIDIIEAVERPDKTFVLGLQFHPEIAVIQQQNEDFLVYFTTLVEEASQFYHTGNDLDPAA